MNGDWLSVREVAAALRRSEPTVRRAIGRKDLTVYTFGERGYYVSADDLETFIQKSRSDGADAAAGAAGTEANDPPEAA